MGFQTEVNGEKLKFLIHWTIKFWAKDQADWRFNQILLHNFQAGKSEIHEEIKL